jgi:VIT1/CCC1 family predicted Fe2+/Mn2+ transporter
MSDKEESVDEFKARMSESHDEADWDLNAMLTKAINEMEDEPSFAEKAGTFIGKIVGVLICIAIFLFFFSWCPIITSIILILAGIGWIAEKKAS